MFSRKECTPEYSAGTDVQQVRNVYQQRVYSRRQMISACAPTATTQTPFPPPQPCPFSGSPPLSLT